MRFTIITPTVLRPSLAGTCWSIEKQSHKEWHHIVVVDVPGATIPEGLRHPQREWVICPIAHNNFGNSCRASAYELAAPGTSYILNLDDDDVYLPGAFDALNRALSASTAAWAVFPALRLGYRFFNLPPGHCRTMNCQFAHRPIINGQEIRYPDTADYCADGMLVETLKSLADPLIIDGPELVEVSRISAGAR